MTIQDICLPFNCSESVSIAPGTGAIGDIVEHLRVGVEDRVHEAHRPLAHSETLLVDLEDPNSLANCRLHAQELRHTKFRTEANSGDARLAP